MMKATGVTWQDSALELRDRFVSLVGSFIPHDTTGYERVTVKLTACYTRGTDTLFVTFCSQDSTNPLSTAEERGYVGRASEYLNLYPCSEKSN